MCHRVDTARVCISIHALLAESDNPVLAVTSEVSDFYPRSPCGERLGLSYFYIIKITISIHALLAESDGHDPGGGRICQGFLSTLSLRRATMGRNEKSFRGYFYPRSPCGERHILVNTFLAILEFLSTLSLRRATASLV